MLGSTLVLVEERSVGSLPFVQNHIRIPFPVEPKLLSMAYVPPPALFNVLPHEEEDSSDPQPGFPDTYAEQFVFKTSPVWVLIELGMVQLDEV